MSQALEIRINGEAEADPFYFSGITPLFHPHFHILFLDFSFDESFFFKLVAFFTLFPL